jgi:hypothetical protein
MGKVASSTALPLEMWSKRIINHGKEIHLQILKLIDDR